MWILRNGSVRPPTTGSVIFDGPIRAPQRAASTQYGACDIDSAPPASATSTSPVWMCIVAVTIDWTPDPQSRLTVSAGDSCGTPALIATTRDMYMSFVLLWITLPKTTCSIWSGRRPERSIAAFAAVAPRSVASTSLSDFP